MATCPIAMTQEHKRLLRQFRLELVENLDVRYIMDHLVSEGVITLEMKDTIMSNRGRSQQVSALLDLLERRDDRTFTVFLQALKTDYKFLYEPMRKASLNLKVTTSDKYYYVGADVLKMAIELVNSQSAAMQRMANEPASHRLPEVPPIGQGKREYINEESEYLQTSSPRDISPFSPSPRLAITSDGPGHPIVRHYTPLDKSDDLRTADPPVPTGVMEKTYVAVLLFDVQAVKLTDPRSTISSPLSREEKTTGDETDGYGSNETTQNDEKAREHEYERKVLSMIRKEETDLLKTETDENQTPARAESAGYLRSFMSKLSSVSGEIINSIATMGIPYDVSEESSDETQGDSVFNPEENVDGDSLDRHSYGEMEEVNRHDSMATMPEGYSGKTDADSPDQTDSHSIGKEPLTLERHNNSSVVFDSPEEVTGDSGIDEWFSRRSGTKSLLRHSTRTDSYPSVTETSYVKLMKGDMVIVNPSNNTGGEEYLRVHDICGQELMVPLDCIKKYGEPKGEKWFYPVPISVLIASVLLKGQPMGTYLFYKTQDYDDNERFPYNLSFVQDSSGTVAHRYVNLYSNGLYGFSEQQRFATILDLQSYYQKNRGCLPCRLRRCPVPNAAKSSVGDYVDKEHRIDPGQLSIQKWTAIGRGSFGHVQQGLYQGKKVAVKTLHCDDEGPLFLEDFLGEAQVMLQLRHEHIVHCLGVCVPEDSSLHIVMELAEKRDLRHCLKSGQVSVADLNLLFRLCRELLAALCYLENHRVVHRDVATRNMFIDGQWSLKLGDFGMARQVDGTYRAEEHEAVPMRWASPEVLQQLLYSRHSDIWAAGISFWEMFSAGNRPYAGMAGAELTKCILSSRRLDRPEGCPEHIYNLMLSCWAAEPKSRPTASSLLCKLKAWRYYSGETIAPADESLSAGSLTETEASDFNSPVYQNFEHSAREVTIPKRMKKTNVMTKVKKFLTKNGPKN